SQRRHQRLHRQKDSSARQRSESGGQAGPQRSRFRHAPSATGKRLFRNLQPRQRALIDTLVDEPIECITPHGIKTTRQEHEFDILIYATGFDGVTGATIVSISAARTASGSKMPGPKPRAPISACSPKASPTC